MDSVYAHIDHGPFPDFYDFLLNLFPGFINHLLYPGRMDPAIGNQLVKCQPCNLPSDRVKTRKYNGLGRIIDNYFNPGGRFKGPDVPSLAPDDTALDLIVIDVENGH